MKMLDKIPQFSSSEPDVFKNSEPRVYRQDPECYHWRHAGVSPAECNNLFRASVSHFLFIVIVWMMLLYVVTDTLLQELEKSKFEVNFFILSLICTVKGFVNNLLRFFHFYGLDLKGLFFEKNIKLQ